MRRYFILAAKRCRIYAVCGVSQTPNYNIILSNTLKIVMLDDEIKFNGKTDTDGDLLTDWNEIEQDKISVNADNTISLLTYKEYLSKYCFAYNLCLSNFAKIKNKNGKSLDDFLNTIYVLPVKTDPSKADTDNDGVNDNLDPYPLENHSFAILDEYLTTDTWGSKYFDPDADDLEYVSNPRDYYDTIVIHHSNRSQNEKITALEKHETKSNKNHFNGIPYHFVINGSGTIYQGRAINYKGAHVASNNTGKIGVCLMGNFQSDNNGLKQIIKSALPTTPTNSQYEAMEELIKVLETQYDIQYSGGHKDFVVNGNTTECPGDSCYTMLLNDGYIKLP